MSDDGSATLTWNAVAEATSYRVYRSASAGGSYSLIASPTTTSYGDTGLTNGTTYYYVVRAHSGIAESENSQQVSVTPGPLLAAPTGVSAVSLNATVTLSWAVVADASGYRVYRALNSGGPYTLVASPAGESYTDTGLSDGTTYFYVVRAHSADGESANSQEVSATISMLPAPLGVAVARGDGVLAVSWSPVDGAVGYRVFRSTISGGPYTLIASPVLSRYLDEGLANDTAHYYVVRAYSGERESLDSSQVSATPQNLAAPPPSTLPSDEFSSSALPAHWTTWDGYGLGAPGDSANHATFEVTSSHLSIAFPGGVEHNMWLLKHAAVLSQYPGSGIYETKVDTALTGDQQFGLVFQQSENTFLVFMLYAYTGDRVDAYVERFIFDGITHDKTTFPGPGMGAPLEVSMPAAGPFYVRVAVTDEGQPEDRSWVFSWSPDGVDWYVLVDEDLEGAAANENIGVIDSVGMFAGNQPANFDALDAQFDYFRYYPDAASMPAPAPTNLVARAGDNYVELWWDPDPAAINDSYNVYAASEPNEPFTLLTTTTETTFNDFSVSNNSSRSYLVRGVRSGFEGPASLTVSATAHALTEFASVPTNGLIVALSASELAALELTDGQPVTQWPNVIGPQIAARGVLKGTPTFVAAGLNGKPVVRFDGEDDFLQLPAGFADFTEGLSLYVVLRPTTLPAGFKVLALGNGPGIDAIALGRGVVDAAKLQYLTNDTAGVYGFFETPSGFVPDEGALFSVLQDGGAADASITATIAKNGITSPGWSDNVYVPPVVTRNLNYIGKSLWPGDGWLQGDIAEILIYNRILTVSEDAAITNYVMTKYGL